MIIHYFLLTHNPFAEAYLLSDLMGKMIFISLCTLSILSWVLMIYKWKLIKKSQENNDGFEKIFRQHKSRPLEIPIKKEENHPFLALYLVLKRHTIELLAKNNQLLKEPSLGMLSSTDIDSVASLLYQERRKEAEKLEKHIYILSMITTLAPFLGLLGTVWGILMSLSHLHEGAGGSQMIMVGISLALATTVIGLLDAIPSLIGYHVLKQKVKKIDSEMENFTTDILAAVELTYRKVDL